MYLIKSSLNKYNGNFAFTERLDISNLITLRNNGYLLFVLSRYLTSTRDDRNILLSKERK